jgi:hypothetical protein
MTAPSTSLLADALFTSTQQKVLGLLFGQPDRSFFVTEIMGLVKAGSGAVQRELHRLEHAGLVSVQMHGNQKHYQANRKSPLYDEICSIVQKTVGLEEPLRTAVESMPGTALYTNEEFNRRRARGNSFLKRVLDGPVIILSGSIDGE